MNATTRIIYLHGFRSSPLSAKASLLAQKFDAMIAPQAVANRPLPAKLLGQALPTYRYYCPQLPASPKLAMDLVVERYAPGPQDCLIGSSLGGYYAAYLAETFGCRCVLLNPAVRPARDLAPYVGEHKMFHSDHAFVFQAEYLSELRALEISGLSEPSRYFLIAAKGDELLDWREMLAKYPAGTLKLLEESDHALSDFDSHLDQVVDFCLAEASSGS